MMRKILIAAALMASPVFAATQKGTVLPKAPVLAKGTVLGKEIRNLKLEQDPSVQAELIGGTVVTPGKFPGVFYTRQGSSRCTGTVIGSRVVISAAHCMSNGGSLELTHAGKTYKGKCTHAPEYRKNSTADWALCLLADEITDPIAESINTDASRVKVGGQIVLMGYGCIKNGGGGGNDGKLRVGTAPITRMPSGTNFDIVTRGASALCFGDSGGPSFFVDVDSGARWQTGVNSRGDIKTTSYLSSMHNQTVQKFITSWSASKGVKICGLHADATGCRANK